MGKQSGLTVTFLAPFTMLFQVLVWRGAYTLQGHYLVRLSAMQSYKYVRVTKPQGDTRSGCDEKRYVAVNNITLRL